MIDVVCDLDGVLYRGGRVIVGVPEALALLVDNGARLTFITNNSTRTPRQVADKISRLTGMAVRADSVITSAMAAAGLLTVADQPVLVIGEEGIGHALSERGWKMTNDPAIARSVMVGLWRDVTYDHISAAADAIRGGARFMATNTDPTYPTSDGLAPGAGVIVAAIATASGVIPEVAGKPHPPMRRLIRERGVGEAWVIGDRIDTDVAMAAAEPDWTSILVLTGVTDRATPGADADHVVADLSAAADVVLQTAGRR